ARALVAGEGFSNPFRESTGPTAWMPPVLPAILAALLWVCDGDRDAVMSVVIFLQVYTFILTGVLAMALARRTCRQVGPWVVLAVFVGGLLCHFHMCFQFTHDSWLVLLALDLVI